jgi:hypothetical protein
MDSIFDLSAAVSDASRFVPRAKAPAKSELVIERGLLLT